MTNCMAGTASGSQVKLFPLPSLFIHIGGHIRGDRPVGFIMAAIVDILTVPTFGDWNGSRTDPQQLLHRSSLCY